MYIEHLNKYQIELKNGIISFKTCNPKLAQKNETKLRLKN